MSRPVPDLAFLEGWFIEERRLALRDERPLAADIYRDALVAIRRARRLEPFVRHAPTCHSLMRELGDPVVPACTCGLDAAQRERVHG